MSMKSKDCFYGQVRALGETFNGTLNTVVPTALNVTKQEAITWNNVTGMNPLWNQSEVPYNTYKSYAEMIRVATESGSTYANEFAEAAQSDDFYHEQIASDYSNDYSRLCHTLAPLWMLHQVLSAPDALAYDYLIARQYDTWFNYPNDDRTNELIKDILGEYTEKVAPNKDKDVPIVYAVDIPSDEVDFPIVGNIASYFLIFNREAVKVLKDEFFFYGLNEMDKLYSQVGPSKFLNGNVGNVFCKIFFKNDIRVIDISKFNLCFIKTNYSKNCKDYGRLERASGEREMRSINLSEHRKKVEQEYSESDYQDLQFTLKDCMYGQVRAIDDNVYRSYGAPGVAFPSTIPAALKPFIPKQQVITWNNNTGMNPLWEQAPTDDVIHESYGNMIRDAYEISVHNGLTYVPNLIEGGMSAQEYDKKIRDNHDNEYSMICLSLGFWWHIHQLLNQPDVFDYDYLMTRQMDTWYYPLITRQQIHTIFEHSRKQVLLSPQYDEPTVPLNDIPVVWGSGNSTAMFPMPTWINSHSYVFNQASIKLLQKDFFTKILQEIEIFYNRSGPKCKVIMGKPGTLFHHVAVKNDITIIDTAGNTLCWIPDRRTVSCAAYSRKERNVNRVTL